MARPANLQYAFNDKVSLGKAILFACQYLIPNMVSIIFADIVLQQIHVSALTAASVISISMIMFALISFLQALPRLGSGILLPPSVAPSYLAQSILAVKMGGLPLVFGMTLFAGIFQTAFSFVISISRRIFPSEIAALILLLIGIELGYLGVGNYLQIPVPIALGSERIVFHVIEFLPLFLILVLDQFGVKALKNYSLFISVVVSYLAIYFLGFMDPEQLTQISQASWFFIPHLAMGHYHFSFELIVPFLIGAFLCGIKNIGVISALQEIQTTEEMGPQLPQLAKANFIDGLGTLISGFAGSMGMNSSSSGIALSLSKGVTSRYIAYPLAAIAFSLAFCPKISLILALLPKAIIAAVLIDLGTSLILSSVKVIVQNAKQLKSQLCLGIAFTIGLSNSVYPIIYKDLPNYIRVFTGSSMALATLVAIFLHLLFFKKN